MSEQINKVTDHTNTSRQEPIAIIGIGCRFPGGSDFDQITSPEAYWKFLEKGGNAITDVPADRWSLDEFYDPDPLKAGKIKNSKGGFLKNIADFDTSFFGYYPAEANRIDPQQRILLEVTLEALEDAGIRLEDFSNTKTAVYTGMFMNDYWDIQTSSLQRDQTSPHVAMGSSRTSAANRLSYFFNLKGPSVTIDTACSSSLVGVHLACQSIWSGESELGLAGGVNLILRPESSIMMSKGNFLSPDGYCKSFDSRANGYVRSEGCGMVLLKPLSKAEADGDHIYAVILGSAVNQDGFTEDGFTVPSVDSQIEMLKTAYRNASIDPSQVDYIEAHGTGTPVGDPIETKAFGEVIGKNRSEHEKFWIGSVKSNIGHLEAAAGVAGLIKLSLVLRNRKVPQNLHFENPNPKILFDEYKLKVPTKLEFLVKTGAPLIGGVNSFGAGGTNAHIVLQEYQVNRSLPSSKEQAHLFTISSKSVEGLKASAEDFVNYLGKTKESIENISFSAATRRTHHKHRLTITARSNEVLAEHLSAFLKGETRPGMHLDKQVWQKNPKIGFIYSGQGPQWYAMGQQLIKASPLFRDTILQIEKIFSQIADWSLLNEMSKDEKTSRISDTRIAQPSIMAIQIALTELWRSWGIVPDGCVGHSIGEVAAAYTAGALTLEQAVEVIYHRSRGQNKATDKGKMLAVALSLSDAKMAIKGYEDRVSIAAINGPEMLTLSGDAEPLELIAKLLEEQDVFNRFLRVNVPFHSHHMVPLKEELITSLKDLRPHKASLPLYSTVTGMLENGEHLTSEYWYRNVREPVYFTDAVQKMIDDGFETFIEIAPHPVLTEGTLALLSKNKKEKAQVIPSLRRNEDEEITMMSSLGKLHTIGYSIHWNNIFDDSAQYVQLPTYAWQKEYCWFESKENAQKRLGTQIHPYLSQWKKSAIHAKNIIWDVDINPAKHNYIEDHKVDGSTIFPGTGHLEVAYAAGKASFPENFSHLENVRFESPLFLPEEGETPLTRLEISAEEDKYYLCTQSQEEHQTWTKHSSGTMVCQNDAFVSRPKMLSEIQQKFQSPVSVADYYLELKESGLQYGEAFRRIKKLWVDKESQSILAQISLSKRCTYGIERFNFHPTLSDACLHAIEYAGKWTNEAEKSGIYLPTFIKKFKIHQQPSSNLFCYIQINDVHENHLIADYWIFNEDGTLSTEIQGLECKYIEGSRGEDKDALFHGMYEFQWQKQEEDSKSIQALPLNKEIGNKILLFADQGGIAKEVLSRFQKDHLLPVVIYQGKGFEEVNERQFSVDSNKESDIQQVFQRLNDQGLVVDRILYLWALDAHTDQNMTAQALQNQQEELANAILNTYRSIVGQELEPMVQIVTQGVESVQMHPIVNLSQASVYGTSRVMMNEYPFIATRLIDLSTEVMEEELDWLYSNLVSETPAHYPEMALRGKDRLVRKLTKVTEESAQEKASQMLPAYGSHYSTSIEWHGEHRRFIFRKNEVPVPGAQEVVIEVKATGLTLRDMIMIEGTASTAEENAFLGWECSGIITAIGSEVTSFKPGDEVFALTPNSLSGYVLAKEAQVILKPIELNFEEAAGIPVAYLSAYYALRKIAQLEGDEWIYIQGASSPIGLAAIQLAQLMDANIVASIDLNSEHTYERSYLRSLGIKHILDTSSTRFAEDIDEVTQGKGVNVLLNIYTDFSKEEGFRCLAPFGKYIDLHHSRHKKLGMTLKSNISYHTLSIDQFATQKPSLCKSMLQEITQLFEQRKLNGLPTKVYPIQDLEKAFQKLSNEGYGYIGKTVVNLDKQPIKVMSATTLRLSPDATYLITGGASGFGLSLAEWLTKKGARHLVLMSRNGGKLKSDFQTVDRLKANGVQVHLVNVDITDERNVQQEIDKIRTTMPPLKGIIHGAAVLDDATLQNTNLARFMKVFLPKVLGGWNLHLATQHDKLDFFLMLSSISSMFGLPGQSAYSSANNFLDKLAFYRQSQGLKASSINLGVLGQYAGMSREGGQVINVLANQGWLPLSIKQVTEKIESMILQQPAQRMVANLDWGRFRNFFTHLEKDVRFAEFLNQDSAANKPESSSFEDEMQHASPDQQKRILKLKLTEALAKILGTSPDKIDPDVSIAQIGLDSLMLNQLRNWIQQKLSINFPLMKIAKGPSIDELAAMLVDTSQDGVESNKTAETKDTSGISSGEETEVINDWLVRNKNNDQEIERRIFCIHPVGAGASMFSHFLFNPPKNTDVIAFQLPGRENRSGEEPYMDMEQLIPDMANIIRPYLDKPFVVIGHSFGGVIGFELIRFLRKHHGIKALKLFVSGTIAPQLTQDWKKSEAIAKTAVRTNSEEKIIGILNYIDDVDFFRQILPVMRNDMPLLMSYQYTEDEKFDFPITAFAGNKDEVVSIDEVGAWKTQTSDTFTLEVVEGDHWFLSRNKEIILQRLKEAVEQTNLSYVKD